MFYIFYWSIETILIVIFNDDNVLSAWTKIFSGLRDSLEPKSNILIEWFNRQIT